MVLRVLWGGGEWVWGTLCGDRGVVSLGNMVVCGEFCRDAVVDSWCSSVHVAVFPGDVVVSVFSGGSWVVWA